jgi:hypothetical protein
VEPPQEIGARIGVVEDLHLDVGLVEDHGHVSRDLLEEGLDLSDRQRRPRRVVRVADDHELGGDGDLGRHRVEVVLVAVVQGNADLASA